MIQAYRYKMCLNALVYSDFSSCNKCFLDHCDSGALLESPVPEQEGGIGFSCVGGCLSLKFSFYYRNQISKCLQGKSIYIYFIDNG